MSPAPVWALALGLVLGGFGTAAAAPLCEEDRSTGEPPTISSRFDLKEPGEGVAFTAARARALAYCARQACTIDGESRAREASIYALTLLHRRYVAGFRCVPAQGPAAASGAGPLSYPLHDPSGIDAAHADAEARCAPSHVKAELADLRKDGDGLIAVFACGS
jgi:hypothetical protein